MFELALLASPCTTTRPKSVDGRQYAELPCTHPASAKLYINLRSIITLHTAEEDRSIRLIVLIAMTLGRIEQTLIIRRTKVRTSTENVNVGRNELAVKVFLVVDELAFNKAWVEPKALVDGKGWRRGMLVLVSRKSAEIDHWLVRSRQIRLAAR